MLTNISFSLPLISGNRFISQQDQKNITTNTADSVRPWISAGQANKSHLRSWKKTRAKEIMRPLSRHLLKQNTLGPWVLHLWSFPEPFPPFSPLWAIQISAREHFLQNCSGAHDTLAGITNVNPTLLNLASHFQSCQHSAPPGRNSSLTC